MALETEIYFRLSFQHNALVPIICSSAIVCNQFQDLYHTHEHKIYLNISLKFSLKSLINVDSFTNIF